MDHMLLNEVLLFILFIFKQSVSLKLCIKIYIFLSYFSVYKTVTVYIYFIFTAPTVTLWKLKVLYTVALALSLVPEEV